MSPGWDLVMAAWMDSPSGMVTVQFCWAWMLGGDVIWWRSRRVEMIMDVLIILSILDTMK